MTRPSRASLEIARKVVATLYVRDLEASDLADLIDKGLAELMPHVWHTSDCKYMWAQCTCGLAGILQKFQAQPEPDDDVCRCKVKAWDGKSTKCSKCGKRLDDGVRVIVELD